MVRTSRVRTLSSMESDRRAAFSALLTSAPLELEQPLNLSALEEIVANRQRAPKGALQRVVAFDLSQRSADRAAPEEGRFMWTPVRAQRQIGLGACVLVHEGAAGTIVDGVNEILHTGEKNGLLGRFGPGSLCEWVGSLNTVSRGFVAIAASNWATNLWNALTWEMLGNSARLSPPDRWWKSDWANVALRSRSEVSLHLDGHGATYIRILSGRPTPSSATELALEGLVHHLAHKGDPYPARIGGYWPQSGRHLVVDVDQRILTGVAERIRSVLDARMSRPIRLAA